MVVTPTEVWTLRPPGRGMEARKVVVRISANSSISEDPGGIVKEAGRSRVKRGPREFKGMIHRDDKGVRGALEVGTKDGESPSESLMRLPPPGGVEQLPGRPTERHSTERKSDGFVLFPAVVLGGHFGNGSKPPEAGAARLVSSQVALARDRCGVCLSGRKRHWDSAVGCRECVHPTTRLQAGHLPKPCQVNLPAAAVEELQDAPPCFARVSCCCPVVKTPSGPGTLLAMQSPGSSGLFVLGETLFSRLWWQESGCG